jgi:predicted AlkP superfamily pyrophosphatase or phosphodiesterase
MNRVVFFLLLTWASIAAAQKKSSPKPIAAQSAAPKLVIAIIIDQFRFDYLDKFAEHYVPATKTSGGFQRLLQNGALMTNAHYPYINTYTAPGHATFLTGVAPERSGIVGNEWIDRSTNRTTYCVEDTTVQAVGIEARGVAGQMSPKNCFVETVCDRLKSFSPKSKVIGIAIKDRGAVLPAGKRADGAFWFDVASGNWISSTYYFKDGKLPTWVQDFNARKLPDSYIGKPWLRLLPDTAYTMLDDVQGESTLLGEQRPVFPHLLVDISKLADPRLRRSRKYDVIPPTPFGNELTIAFAEAALDAESLGKRGVTDILTVSFSSPDYCGHAFGPESQEQMDILIRLDRQLDAFFQTIDKKVGFDNCIFILSADHGVSPLPELHGGVRLFKKEFLDTLKSLVHKKYPDVVSNIENDEILLDAAAVQKAGATQRDVERFVGESAKLLRGVVGYITRSELLQEPLHPLSRMVKRCFHPSRSGDVKLILSPYSFFAYAQTGTTHGTAYDYDTHVPILFCGKGVRQGRYASAAFTIDTAPTLHRLLGLPETDQYEGRALLEIFTRAL